MAGGRLSQTGFNHLKASEGITYKAAKLTNKGYTEPYCTVCIGHYGIQGDVVCGKTYTDAECMAFFAKDSERFTTDVNKIYDTSKGMTQNMFDAMFSFAYNHGNISQTKLGDTIKANPKDFKTIQSVWESSYCSGAFAKGLTARRKREAALYCGSSYDSALIPSGGEGSGDSNENNRSLWEWEDAVYSDTSTGVTDVDYGALNQAQAFATSQRDAEYQAFNIIQDASNAVIGATALTISTFKHEGEAEEHSLIVDETVRPTIMQDEHSAKIKEDTDKAEGIVKTTDNQLKPTMPDVPEGAGFAI